MAECAHLWLPFRGFLYRYITCPQCNEKRRVAFRWHDTEPMSISEALQEAVDLGVVDGAEVMWNGRRFS